MRQDRSPRVSPERRRSTRVSVAGQIGVSMAVRHRPDFVPMTVQDASFHGFALVAPKPVGVHAGERLYLLVDFVGAVGCKPVRGVIIPGRVTRRMPHAEGWFCAVEVEDLTRTTWSGLVGWIRRRAEPPPIIAEDLDAPYIWRR